jgi:hypothetical protein
MLQRKAGSILGRLLKEGAESGQEYVQRSAMRMGAGRPQREEVLRRLERDLPELAELARANGGFSADVSGPLSAEKIRTLPVGRENFGGYMMATRPESPAARIPVNVLDDPAALRKEIQRLIKEDPQFVDDLVNGRYLGGWVSDGNLVMDTPRRFANFDASLRAGQRSGQEAGFSLTNIDPYSASMQALPSYGSGAAAAGGAGVGLAALRRLTEE